MKLLELFWTAVGMLAAGLLVLNLMPVHTPTPPSTVPTAPAASPAPSAPPLPPVITFTDAHIGGTLGGPDSDPGIADRAR